MRSRSTLGSGLALAALLVLGGCGVGTDPFAQSGDTGPGSTSIVIGSAAFPENALLAEIYASALADAGVEVTTKLNIGSRETYLRGLQDGSVDLVPEYSGNLLQYFDDTTTTTDPAEVEAALADALPETLSALVASEAANQDSVTVNAATAERYSLRTISDLEPVAGELVLGGPPEWQTRPTGVPGLEETYGLQFKEFKALDSSGPITITSLQHGQVQAANVFTTSPAILENDFRVLEDDKGLFLPGNIVPLINSEQDSPEVTGPLNEVSAALTTQDLLAMMNRVANKEDSALVAAEWVDKQDFEDKAE